MDIKTLYANLRHSKWPIKDSYLYSPIVTFEVDGEKIPMKLVFVTTRGQADQCFVLATTMTALRPEAIIQMYGQRWQIECYFKVAKQYLQFDQAQVQGYDELCGRLAIVMLSYDVLTLAQREKWATVARY
ncbi:transposase [Loigolactobacillus binensis]|uniref:Transposase n=1 Tax=Loigolactobacillus binensis TaxID=2559922 RepID=A0ABW3EHY7_9LACO|nr:transposase [Loigolactobacillus binensis]